MCKVNVRQTFCNSLIQDWGVTGRFSHGTQQNIIEMYVAEKIKKEKKEQRGMAHLEVIVLLFSIFEIGWFGTRIESSRNAQNQQKLSRSFAMQLCS
jgi:hypothetical protein